MSALIPFEFEGARIRVVDDGRFVAADVIAGLMLDRSQLRRLDPDERGVYPVHTPGGIQEVVTVTEPGLYALILGSRSRKQSPAVKRFKRWVTHEVLPALRKTGKYEMKPKPQKNKMARLSLRTSTDRLAWLKLASERTGLKQTTIIERALDDWAVKLQIEDAERERLIQASKQYLLSRPIP